MTTPQKYLGRKAVKATVRHSVRGTAAKARREPPRTLVILGIGITLGAIASWLLAKRTGASADPFPSYVPPAPPATQSTPEAKAAAAV